MVITLARYLHTTRTYDGYVEFVAVVDYDAVELLARDACDGIVHVCNAIAQEYGEASLVQTLADVHVQVMSNDHVMIDHPLSKTHTHFNRITLSDNAIIHALLRDETPLRSFGKRIPATTS